MRERGRDRVRGRGVDAGRRGAHLGARPRPALRRRRLRGHPLLRRHGRSCSTSTSTASRRPRGRSCSSCRLTRAAIAALCHEAVARAAASTTATCASSSRAASGALGVSPHTCARPTLILIAAPLALYPPERLPRRRRARHLEPAPQRARRAAAAGQEPQLPDERAGLDRGAPPGRRRGDAAERAGPDRRVHGRQPLRRQPAGACSRRRRRERRARRASRARSCMRLLGEQGIEADEARAHAGRRVDGRRAVPDRHRRRDRARARGRRPAAAGRRGR